MTTPIEYVLQLKATLVTSPIVASFTVVEQKVWPDRGYIRIRMALSNGDFLEAAESFVLADDECVTHRYRYQWIDGERRELRKRWDNVEHYPDLPSFPHHVRVGTEENVEPGERLSIIQLLDVLAGEIPTCLCWQTGGGELMSREGFMAGENVRNWRWGIFVVLLAISSFLLALILRGEVIASGLKSSVHSHVSQPKAPNTQATSPSIGPRNLGLEHPSPGLGTEPRSSMPDAQSPNPQDRYLLEAAKWYKMYHDLRPEDLLGLKKLVEICEELEKRRQGEGETGRQGEGMESCRRAAEQIAEGKVESPAAVLREELERRTDDRRIVAELLGVPLEAVELRENLVENGGFEVWKEGRPERWHWSNMATGDPWNLALFRGGFDEFEAYEGERAMRVDGFWIQRKPELEGARAGYWGGEIELKPNTPYVLSFYYRTRNLREGRAAIWVSYDPEVLFSGDHMLPDTKGEWRKFVIIGWNGKGEPTRIRPLLRTWGVGNVWFDGVMLREMIIRPGARMEDTSTRFKLR